MSGLTDTSLNSRIAQAYERSEHDSSIVSSISEFPITRYGLQDLSFQYAAMHQAMDNGDVILLPGTDVKETTTAAVAKGLDDLLADRISKLVLFVPDQRGNTYTIFLDCLKKVLMASQINELTRNDLIAFSSFNSFAEEAHHRADIIVSNAQILNRLELKTLFNMTGIGSKIALCGVDDGQENGFTQARKLIRNQEVGRPSVEFNPTRSPV